MVPQGDASFPKQVALLFPAAVFRADASMNRSILSSDSLLVIVVGIVRILIVKMDDFLMIAVHTKHVCF